MQQEKFYKRYIILQTVSVFSLVIFSLLQCSINHKLTRIQEEVSLRPVILRSNKVDWERLKPLNLEDAPKDINKLKETQILEFSVLRNIATDVEGEIILNKTKYRLHFFDDINQVFKPRISCEAKWGWVKPDNNIYAFFSEFDKEPTKKENQIVVRYKDIKGNKYCTNENKNYSATACRSKL